MSWSTQNNAAKKRGITVAEMAIFAMFGALMYVSKVLMQLLPNIHLLGMLIMTVTVVFRKKALIPLYLYILLEGLFAGFSVWWIPYLYIWTVLWGVTMLLPRHMPKKIACIVYPVVCCLHGLSFGTLYAPAQALLFGMNMRQTIAWILAGLPWDLLHGISNFVAGWMILPLSALLFKIIKNQPY